MKFLIPLFIVSIMSLEFIDSKDDPIKSYLKGCFSDNECVWLQIDKKDLTNKRDHSIIVNAIDKLIQMKEGQ